MFDPISLGTMISGAKLGYDIFAGERSYGQQLKYNKLLTEREDTAYQRKAADLKAAGFSKNMAVSGPGATAGALKVGTTPTAGEENPALTYLKIQEMRNQVGISQANKNILNQQLIREKRTTQAYKDYGILPTDPILARIFAGEVHRQDLNPVQELGLDALKKILITPKSTSINLSNTYRDPITGARSGKAHRKAIGGAIQKAWSKVRPRKAWYRK